MGFLKALDPLLQPVVDKIYDENIADRVIGLIRNNIQPPYSIAVNGAWGTGKTTILKLIHDGLEQSETDVTYPTIWFNPWEYDNSGDVVLALERAIALKFQNVFGVSLRELGIFGLTLMTAGLDTISKFVTQGYLSYTDTKTIQENVREAIGSAEYEKYGDSVKAIKDDFVQLTTKKIPNKYKSKPLIIFLDDLDRCLPENTIKILEALKNLFIIENANVIIICGIDTNVAKSFIKKRYEGIDDDFAINYFRKIFNTTLDLPYKSQLKLKNYLQEYVNSLFDTNKVEPNEIADIVCALANNSGVNSLRTLLNIINDYFIILKTCNTNLPFKFIFPFLFLKEVWNSFFVELSIEARRQFSHDNTATIKTAIDRIGALLNNNERLRYLIHNNNILQLNIKDILDANLL